MVSPWRRFGVVYLFSFCSGITGCSDDGGGRTPVVDTAPPTVAAIAQQSAVLDQLFALDVAAAAAISDDHDAVGALRFSVEAGPGAFSGRVYLHTFQTAGTQTIRFRVADSSDNAASGSFDVVVADQANLPPVVDAIPTQTATAGVALSLDLAAFTSDDHDADADLTFVALTEGASFAGSVLSATFANAGLAQVELVVIDTAGAATRASLSVDVLQGDNRPPSLATIPDQGCAVGEPFALDVAAAASVSDDRDPSDALIYEITGGPGVFSGSVYLHTFDAVGDQQIDFRVTDRDGAFVTGRFAIAVRTHPVADFSWQPKRGVLPLSVTFQDATAGDATSWEWDFDADGVIDSTEQHPTVEYTTSGHKSVRLEVRGPGGVDVEQKHAIIEVVPAWAPAFAPALTDGPLPGTRIDAARAYDEVRQVTVMFGGNDGTGGRRDTWEFSGRTWTHRETPGLPGIGLPLGRAGHGLAYDAARGVTVLFGGYSPAGRFSDTWTWDGTRWLDVTPSGTERIDFPSARANPAMAYDPGRSVVVLVGGYDGAPLAETWEWDGVAWTDVTPAGTPGVDMPPPLYDAGLAYDGAAGHLLLFGGLSSDQWEAGTWTWDGASWTDVSPTGVAGVDFPEGRIWPGLAYDSRRSVVVLVGGSTEAGPSNDVWEWSAGAWTEVTVTAGIEGVHYPTAGSAMSMVYDATLGAVLAFRTGGGRDYNDPWAWDGSAWSSQSAKTWQGVESPDTRLALMATWDESRDVAVVVDEHLTWEWDRTDWTIAFEGESGSDHPSAAPGMSMVYDSARGEAVVFSRLTWAWDGVGWTDKSAGGNAGIDMPDAEGTYCMAYDPVREVIVLFGGRSFTTLYGDTWEWDGLAWDKRVVSGLVGRDLPQPREYCAMTWAPVIGEVVLHGGKVGAVEYAFDLWSWDGQRWLDRTPAGDPGIRIPPAQGHHDLVYHAGLDRILLFGGAAPAVAGLPDRDLWMWDGESFFRVATPGTEGVDYPRWGATLHLFADTARGTVMGVCSTTCPTVELWELWP